MTNDEWSKCGDALEMLDTLKIELSAEQYRALKPILWRYLLACCNKISHLLPQKAIQDGLRGAKKYLDGQIDREELSRLDWHAEAECFSLDYEGITIRGESPITLIPDLHRMTRTEAIGLATNAAYCASKAIVGIVPQRRPKIKGSEFYFTDLLRESLPAPFDH